MAKFKSLSIKNIWIRNFAIGNLLSHYSALPSTCTEQRTSVENIEGSCNVFSQPADGDCDQCVAQTRNILPCGKTSKIAIFWSYNHETWLILWQKSSTNVIYPTEC